MSAKPYIRLQFGEEIFTLNSVGGETVLSKNSSLTPTVCSSDRVLIHDFVKHLGLKYMNKKPNFRDYTIILSLETENNVIDYSKHTHENYSWADWFKTFDLYLKCLYDMSYKKNTDPVSVDVDEN